MKSWWVFKFKHFVISLPNRIFIITCTENRNFQLFFFFTNAIATTPLYTLFPLFPKKVFKDEAVIGVQSNRKLSRGIVASYLTDFFGFKKFISIFINQVGWPTCIYLSHDYVIHITLFFLATQACALDTDMHYYSTVIEPLQIWQAIYISPFLSSFILHSLTFLTDVNFTS